MVFARIVFVKEHFDRFSRTFTLHFCDMLKVLKCFHAIKSSLKLKYNYLRSVCCNSKISCKTVMWISLNMLHFKNSIRTKKVLLVAGRKEGYSSFDSWKWIDAHTLVNFNTRTTDNLQSLFSLSIVFLLDNGNSRNQHVFVSLKLDQYRLVIRKNVRVITQMQSM